MDKLGEKVIIPDWPAANSVKAFTTTRVGGVSQTPYDSLNLGDHVGDELERVARNRAKLGELLGPAVKPVWLEQVHGTEVLRLDSLPDSIPRADASTTRQPNLACAVLTADCLPILLCSKQGDWVAAVHAGWRGLASGVLDNAISCFSGKKSDLMAWLGPAIGANRFEVGDDVKQAFCSADESFANHFCSYGEKYLADLYAIAGQKLGAMGIDVYGGEHCTYTDSDRFYSYRRDGKTGRMASVIWIQS